MGEERAGWQTIRALDVGSKCTTTASRQIDSLVQCWDFRNMTTRNERVREQYEKFLRDLPELKKSYAGRWIIYMDGVRGSFADERSALKTAYSSFGREGGFTVVQVVEPETVLLTAALAYRVA